MSAGILLLTHEGFGHALLGAARLVLGRLPAAVDVVELGASFDPDDVLRDGGAKLRALDSGDGVLILTDLYGSSPSNTAARLAQLGTKVRRVAGLNLPMFLRVVNYAEQPLEQLADTAYSGGRNGILIDHA